METHIALVDVVLMIVLELVIIGAVLTVADQLLEWVGVLIGAMVDVNLGVLEIVILIAGKAVLGLINKKEPTSVKIIVVKKCNQFLIYFSKIP